MAGAIAEWFGRITDDKWRIIIVICLILAVYVINKRLAAYNVKDMERFQDKKLKDIARRDLSVIGDTGQKVSISLSTWIYSILVICYRLNPELDVMPVIREWASTAISDKIKLDVEEPYTRFLNVIREAHENQIDPALKDSPEYSKEDETAPKFKVSPEYDYHVLPKSLKFNDYVDCESLMIKIDETIRRSCA